nr:ribonuclease H-like domain, reverse transcriptase, RNA-dependent DNA polymerase [Tanacetum cinerariifolium]GEZ80264.1 ribonuclease H-like domain, reverse transcriptase, RNA-dependent DNA polymerase [Tanacetum cinerariifolium]
MAPLTFADTHNMVVFLSKSDASDGFDQIVDFLNAHTIKYDLMVNPTIYVVVTKAIVRRDLHFDDADGVECLPHAEIFEELARMGYEKPPPKLAFYMAFFFAQWKFLIHTIVQCISAKRTTWNEFSSSISSAVICLSTSRKFNFSKYIFDSMVRNVDSPTSVEVPITHAQPSTTSAPSLTKLQDTTPTTHDTPPQYQPPIPHYSPQQDQPTTPYDSPMPLLTTLMETCATLSQKVGELENDKNSQALEILQLKKRVNKLNRKKKSKTLGLKRLRKRLMKKKLLWMLSLRKGQILMLLNMAGYKMEFFKGMTYEEIRPKFKREYSKIQTLFKKDKDVQETKKKRVADETLL